MRISRSFGASRVEQTLVLDAVEPGLHISTWIDWHERRKLLKLAFRSTCTVTGPRRRSSSATSMRTLTGGAPITPLLVVDPPAIVVEAVMLAEDGSGDMVVRSYEATGARVRGTIRADFAASEIRQTDLLERAIEPTGLVGVDGGTARLELRPFQLVTLRFVRR